MGVLRSAIRVKADMSSIQEIARLPVDPLESLYGAIQSPQLCQLLDHWIDIRRGRLMPAWRDIDPVLLAPILPNVWSWKYDRGKDSFTGRLAGDRINSIVGRSLRQVPMTDYFTGADYERIFRRLKRVVTEPVMVLQCGLVFQHEGHQGFGERLILPLADDGEHGDGLIGVTTYELDESSISRMEIIATTIKGHSKLVIDDKDEQFFPIYRDT
jgi:hypothetical protein